jgi:hypothetical protein
VSIGKNQKREIHMRVHMSTQASFNPHLKCRSAMKENGNTKKKTVRRIRALVNEYQLC